MEIGMDQMAIDRERVARAIALADGWLQWDTARTYTHTPNGTDPEECRDGYRDLAEAAIAELRARPNNGINRSREAASG